VGKSAPPVAAVHARKGVGRDLSITGGARPPGSRSKTAKNMRTTYRERSKRRKPAPLLDPQDNFVPSKDNFVPSRDKKQRQNCLSSVQ